MTMICIPLSSHCLASFERHASRVAIASTLHAAGGPSDQFQLHTRIKASQCHFASKSITGSLPLPVGCVSWYASFVPQAVSHCFSNKSASSEDCFFFASALSTDTVLVSQESDTFRRPTVPDLWWSADCRPPCDLCSCVSAMSACKAVRIVFARYALRTWQMHCECMASHWCFQRTKKVWELFQEQLSAPVSAHLPKTWCPTLDAFGLGSWPLSGSGLLLHFCQLGARSHLVWPGATVPA